MTMIYIEKNTQNDFALELTGLTGCDAYFLFEFEFEFTLDRSSRFFTAPDTSSFPSRYNLFSLTESDTGATGDADNVPICLESGQYKYKIYTSSSPIDITNIPGYTGDSPISQGRMVVEGTNLIVPSVYQ